MSCAQRSGEGSRFIVNFPTKADWRTPSKLAYVDSGLKALVDEIAQRRIASIAIPPLGCGLGGLDWADVRPRIVPALEKVPDVRVLLFEPQVRLSARWTAHRGQPAV
jgi:O-acetyl-ADP-ribose deacetylase (regulator of RNase III)